MSYGIFDNDKNTDFVEFCGDKLLLCSMSKQSGYKGLAFSAITNTDKQPPVTTLTMHVTAQTGTAVCDQLNRLLIEAGADTGFGYLGSVLSSYNYMGDFGPYTSPTEFSAQVGSPLRVQLLLNIHHKKSLGTTAEVYDSFIRPVARAFELTEV